MVPAASHRAAVGPSPAGPLEDARASIAANRAALRSLETAVEALWAAGDASGAAGLAQAAGEHAMRNHPGVFASPRLERVLLEIGMEHLPTLGARRADGGDAPRVLHVLTEGYATGGHTRQAWRWIERDSGRRPTVLLTRQRMPVPVGLAEAVRAAGGDLLALPPSSDPVARARDLRVVAAEHDVVVLHAHPFDVVPVIAFAHRPEGPPVVVMDHADHLFWLGAGVTDILAGCRAPAVDLARDHRRIDPCRFASLPIPFDPAPRTRARNEAKAALGLPADAPVLLTVAAPHKYAPVLQPTFHDAARAVLERVPDAVLVAVGPDPEGDWTAHPRIRAMGRQNDLAPFYEAADLYLDSYPFSSNTSLIEGGSLGTPILSFSPDPEAQGILLSHNQGIEHLIVRRPTPEALAAAARELLADRDARDALGAQIADGIERTHTGPGWNALLEDVYRLAAQAPRATLAPPPREEEPVADFEALHHLLFAATGETAPVPNVLAAHADVLPPSLEAPPAPPRAWTAVARVTPNTDSVREAVAALRRARRERRVDALVVVVAPADVERAVPLIEAELAAGEDVDLELVPSDSVAALLRPGVVEVAA